MSVTGRSRSECTHTAHTHLPSEEGYFAQHFQWRQGRAEPGWVSRWQHFEMLLLDVTNASNLFQKRFASNKHELLVSFIANEQKFCVSKPSHFIAHHFMPIPNLHSSHGIIYPSRPRCGGLSAVMMNMCRHTVTFMRSNIETWRCGGSGDGGWTQSNILAIIMSFFICYRLRPLCRARARRHQKYENSLNSINLRRRTKARIGNRNYLVCGDVINILLKKYAEKWKCCARDLWLHPFIVCGIDLLNLHLGQLWVGFKRGFAINKACSRTRRRHVNIKLLSINGRYCLWSLLAAGVLSRIIES